MGKGKRNRNKKKKESKSISSSSDIPSFDWDKIKKNFDELFSDELKLTISQETYDKFSFVIAFPFVVNVAGNFKDKFYLSLNQLSECLSNFVRYGCDYYLHDKSSIVLCAYDAEEECILESSSAESSDNDNSYGGDAAVLFDFNDEIETVDVFIDMMASDIEPEISSIHFPIIIRFPEEHILISTTYEFYSLPINDKKEHSIHVSLRWYDYDFEYILDFLKDELVLSHMNLSSLLQLFTDNYELFNDFSSAVCLPFDVIDYDEKNETVTILLDDDEYEYYDDDDITDNDMSHSTYDLSEMKPNDIYKLLENM